MCTCNQYFFEPHAKRLNAQSDGISEKSSHIDTKCYWGAATLTDIYGWYEKDFIEIFVPCTLLV